MLEEFYINASEPIAVHFRHARRANVVFCDGHVASEPPLAGSIECAVASVSRMAAGALDILLLP